MDNATFLAFMDGKELLKEGKVDEGRALLKQSADAGMKVACMNMPSLSLMKILNEKLNF